MSHKIKIMSMNDLLFMVSMGEPALRQKVCRANKKDGIMLIPGHGYFIVRKHNGRFQIIKVSPAESNAKDPQQEMSKKVYELMKKQRTHVCEECRAKVIDPMMNTAKENM